MLFSDPRHELITADQHLSIRYIDSTISALIIDSKDRGLYELYTPIFLEDQNTVVRLPALLKYRLGNKFMSYEEIDVGIFI